MKEYILDEFAEELLNKKNKKRIKRFTEEYLIPFEIGKTIDTGEIKFYVKDIKDDKMTIKVIEYDDELYGKLEPKDEYVVEIIKRWCGFFGEYEPDFRAYLKTIENEEVMLRPY